MLHVGLAPHDQRRNREGTAEDQTRLETAENRRRTTHRFRSLTSGEHGLAGTRKGPRASEVPMTFGGSCGSKSNRPPSNVDDALTGLTKTAKKSSRFGA
jgi:hypothetical protein